MGIKFTSLHESKPLTSGQPVTLQVPIYGTIHNMMLRFTEASGAAAAVADIISEIQNIRLSFNGRDIVNASPANIFAMYEALGLNVFSNTGVVGNIELNLGRLLFNNPSVRDNFGYGTAGLTTIQATVTAATLTNVANVQAISGRTQEQRALGTYCKFIDYPQSFNATGDHTVDTLPRDPDSAYAAVLASVGASGAITNGEVRANNATIMERQPIDTNAQMLSDSRLSSPTGYFPYIFNDGAQDSLLPMQGVTDLRFITTFGTAPGAAGYIMSALTVNGMAPAAVK